jgi:hypothetical protein
MSLRKGVVAIPSFGMLSEGYLGLSRYLLSFCRDPVKKMKNRWLFLCAAMIALIGGCSTETLKRSGYETLQNVREQECQKDFSTECSNLESYEAYQRERNDLKTSQ